MRKTKIAMVFSIVLLLAVAGGILADGFTVVTYTDTALHFYTPTDGGEEISYIANGDFSEWTADGPSYWALDFSNASPGWEARPSKMDYALGDGDNYASGMFFRTGPAGSAYGTMSQQVIDGLVSGYYWVQVHITAWEHNTTSAYNAVAWYGFSDSADPNSVTQWRELFPDRYVCENVDQICNHLGRHETVHIEAGDYMHVKMGMKFPDHQAWTVFGIDDISILEIGGETIEDGFIADGVVTWNQYAPR